VSTTATPSGSSMPRIESDEARSMIREQLELLLESHLFRNSKRYPNMLRHIVERTLAGRSEEIKERSLGVVVFGRPPAYDCNADPVVRMSAAEIRKRLGQYYSEPRHRDQLRIELPVGSYIPEFHWPEGNPPAAVAVEPPAPTVQPEFFHAEPESPTSRRRSLKITVVGSATALVVAAIATFLMWPESALDSFWRPVMVDPQPILLCAAKSPWSPSQPLATGQPDSNRAGIAWADVVTLTRLALLVQSKKHPIQLRREDRATFAELQQGSTILIGAFNDTWTMRLSDIGRYGFEHEGTKYWIVDRQNQGARQWGIDLDLRSSQGKLDLHEDFAIVSRVLNQRTGKMLVTVGGLYGFGTQAAGQFLTDPKYLTKFAASLKSGWESKNLQLVIRTEVIDGTPGPPEQIASWVW
jgi:hypothetical protein